MDSEFTRSLQRRLVALQAERATLITKLKEGNDKLQTMNGAIAGIYQLLQLEGVKPNSGAELNQSPLSANGAKLADVLNSLMADRQYHTVDELVESVKANGFNFERKNPKRAVSFTLLGLARGHKFERVGDGRWRYIG